MRNKAYEDWKKRLAEAAKKTKTPVFAQIELTGRCNLDCKMCYVHNFDAAYCLARELSTQQWKQIFDEAYDNGLMFASLTGGECLLRKDFKELYLHLWNKRVMVAVLTNAVLLTDDYVEFFKTYRPDYIQISLYGSDEEGYLRVTGHRGFEKAVDAIRALTDAGLDVRVVTTPSRYLKEDYLKIVRFCKEQKFNFLYGELLLIENRDDASKNDYHLTTDELIDLACQREALNRPLIPMEQTPQPFGPCSVIPEAGLTCSAGTCLAYMTWDGKMYPCANAMVGGASLLDMSYLDAWKITVEAASKVQQGVECVGCPYDKACPRCPSMRLTDLHSGHCNTAICDLTRRMVAAGVKKLDELSVDPQGL